MTSYTNYPFEASEPLGTCPSLLLEPFLGAVLFIAIVLFVHFLSDSLFPEPNITILRINIVPQESNANDVDARQLVSHESSVELGMEGLKGDGMAEEIPNKIDLEVALQIVEESRTRVYGNAEVQGRGTGGAEGIRKLDGGALTSDDAEKGKEERLIYFEGGRKEGEEKEEEKEKQPLTPIRRNEEDIKKIPSPLSAGRSSDEEPCPESYKRSYNQVTQDNADDDTFSPDNQIFPYQPPFGTMDTKETSLDRQIRFQPWREGDGGLGWF